MIAAVLPAGAVSAEAFSDVPGGVAALFPAERQLVDGSVAGRQAEFGTGRACARRALAALGEPPAPILRDRFGAPGWPAGVVGSITHCDGFRAAAVARAEVIASLGIDAEPDAAVPDGVLEAITATPAERELITALQADLPEVSWDRLLFSAKEAVYKTWYPFALRMIDFSEAEILPFADTARSGGFTARLLSPGPLVGATRHDVLHGRWVARDGLLVCATALRADGTPPYPGHRHPGGAAVRSPRTPHPRD
ncbi:4'-phosphopantetheinyl transferase [Streptomyces sp. NPDC088733]|uniref:4'-phosphopantetheinyl transferase family protein n=1 Tax=Streptomyces sp. NPDC088733 TaxID=3365880 RepID=UPI00382CA98A